MNRARPSAPVGRLVAALVGVAATTAAMPLAGCATERVVHWNPPLAGLPESQSATPVARRDESVDVASLPAEELTVKNPDGSVLLRSPAIRHVMIHLHAALKEEDNALLDQVVSTATRRHFASEGRPPEAIHEFLRTNQNDIMVLFGRMPQAERSPMVKLSREGGALRLRLTGVLANDIRFTELWVVLEGGNWKLLWVR